MHLLCVCMYVLALFVSEEDGLQVQHVGRGRESRKSNFLDPFINITTTCVIHLRLWGKQTHTYKRFGERFFSCVGGESDGCFNEPAPHPLRQHLKWRGSRESLLCR